MGAPLGNSVGAHLPGLTKALETGTFLHRGPVKYHGGGSVHLVLCEIVETGLWKWGISLYGSSVRGTWRGAPLLRALKVMKGRLWGWASVFMGAQLGNLAWAHLPGTLRYG